MSTLIDKDLATRLYDLILWDCRRNKDGTPIYPKTVYLYEDRFFMTNPTKHAKQLHLGVNKLIKIKVLDILTVIGKIT